jgi:hypothetical protein
MLYRRKVVHTEPVDTVTHVERTHTVERDDSSGAVAAFLVVATLAIIAMVWYFAWYRPAQEVVIQPSPTVIETETQQPSPPVVINPPPVINTPPADNDTTIINPPADNDTTIVNPPNTDVDINPPSDAEVSTTGGGG